MSALLGQGTLHAKCVQIFAFGDDEGRAPINLHEHQRATTKLARAGKADDPILRSQERHFSWLAEPASLSFIPHDIERDDVNSLMNTFLIVKRDMAARSPSRTQDAVLLYTLEPEHLGDDRSRVLTPGLDGRDVAGGCRPA